MDNTILRTSFINTAAEKYGFKKQLVDIVTTNNNPFIRTKLIAALLKGKSIGDLLELTDSIAVTPSLEKIVTELKSKAILPESSVIVMIVLLIISKINLDLILLSLTNWSSQEVLLRGKLKYLLYLYPGR